MLGLAPFRPGRRAIASIAVAGSVALAFTVPVALASTSPSGSSATTSTILPALTTTTTGTSSTTSDPASSSTITTPTSTIPTGGTGDGGGAEGLSPLGGGPGQIVPPDAEAFLATLVRSAPNNDTALVTAQKQLLAAGYDEDRSARLAYGRFPVAGPASWADDWLEPRFDGTVFSYHLGIDVIAAFGTPLRAPDDGTVSIIDNPDGGLTVEVAKPDGTFYEMAHMSATADGLRPGAKVNVGDLVGYVGASGTATGPHLHFGYWLKGVTPQSPKPLLDQWVADAAAAIASILHPTPPPRVLLGAALARAAFGDGPGPAAPSELAGSATDRLLVTAANPAGGALQVALAAAAGMATEVKRQSTPGVNP